MGWLHYINNRRENLRPACGGNEIRHEEGAGKEDFFERTGKTETANREAWAEIHSPSDDQVAQVSALVPGDSGR